MKKVVRVLSVLLIVVFAMTSLSGCGGGGEKTTGKTDAKGPIKVGFIYIGHKDDGGFTEAHDMGRVYLEEKLGKDKVETMYKEAVPETKEDLVNAAKVMIDAGCKVIFTTSFGYMDATEELAKDYPDVIFEHFSGYKMNDKNFGNYFGAMEEPRYLSGMVAGMKTKSNKIGFVGAFPITELFIGINAFTLGVQAVNPNATVKVVWTNSWYDPAKEKQAAEALLDSGCDVIAQHCDTTGPQVAAQDKNGFAIGYNKDSSSAAPKAFMTAPVFHHGVFYLKTVQSVIDGTWKPSSYYGNLNDGYVELLKLTEVAPSEAKAKVEEIEKKMKSGEFKIFTGPIQKQNGEEAVKKGESLDREKIWKMNYLIKGVVGTDK